MDEFRIPISYIIELAKTQACTYYLEAHEHSRQDNRTKQQIAEDERSMKYWDQVDKYLEKLQNRRLHP